MQADVILKKPPPHGLPVPPLLRLCDYVGHSGGGLTSKFEDVGNSWNCLHKVSSLCDGEKCFLGR